MRLLRSVGIWAILFVVATTVFQNQESLGHATDFAFLRWKISFVLGFWMFFSFVAGGLLFLILDIWKSLRLRLDLRRRDQQIARLEKELTDLRAGHPGNGAKGAA